jgi:hypothetical protein
MTNTFIIIHPRRAESRLALSLVRDAGGKVIEKNKLGLIVQVKPSIGQTLDLIRLIRSTNLVHSL